MEHIGGALKEFIKKAGLEKPIIQQGALEVWSEVVGEKVSDNTEPVLVEHGILRVKTKTIAWRQELQFQKHKIIKKLNNKLTKKIIKDIRFL